MIARAPATGLGALAEAAAHLREGSALHQRGRLAEAEERYRTVLKLIPNHPEALHFLGVLEWQRGRAGAGLELIERALVIKPDNVGAIYNRANLLRDLGRNQEALNGYERALGFNSDHPGALTNRAALLYALGRYEAAVSACDSALALRPGEPNLSLNRANALNELKRHSEALAAYEAVLRQSPRDAAALYGRGNALLGLERLEEAIQSYDRALAQRPRDGDILNNRGRSLMKLGRHPAALADFDEALAFAPAHTEALINRGNCLVSIYRYGEALHDYERAIAIQPNSAPAHFGRGYALIELKRPDEAIEAFQTVLELDPRYPFALGMLLSAKRHACDWAGHNALVENITAGIRKGERVATAMVLMMSDSAADKLRCARTLMGDADRLPPLAHNVRYAHDRVRITYVSADLHSHPVGRLIAGVLECHDRSRYQPVLVSYGPDDGSPTRHRLVSAAHALVDAREISDRAAAEAIRAREIDIAVDLSGLTGSCRPGILAHRPAPVQVNWLGFASTMGVPFIDYLIADPVAIPPDQHGHYSEAIAYLPNCYLPNDSKRVIGPVPSRKEAGLPETGIVFASFNGSHKITLELFGVWMRILSRVPESVLWIPESNAAARGNLLSEAAARGVSAERLIFAPFVRNEADHLARLSLADMFLDSFPYNAHSTAIDALFAGVPIVTLKGESFAARVAASALHAVDLPELVTSSYVEYEALAFDLATDRARLAVLREKLAASRATAPLFDTARFTRDLEALYARMWERQQAGLPPQSLGSSAGPPP